MHISYYIPERHIPKLMTSLVRFGIWWLLMWEKNKVEEDTIETKQDIAISWAFHRGAFPISWDTSSATDRFVHWVPPILMPKNKRVMIELQTHCSKFMTTATQDDWCVHQTLRCAPNFHWGLFLFMTKMPTLQPSFETRFNSWLLQMYEKQQYEDAISYYTASIAVFPLVPAFNNRAQSCEYCKPSYALRLSYWR